MRRIHTFLILCAIHSITDGANITPGKFDQPSVDNKECTQRKLTKTTNGKVEFHYQGTAERGMECVYNLPKMPSSDYSVAVIKIMEKKLAQNGRCIGLVKLPGQDYRCSLPENECLIYTTSSTICPETDILNAVKKKLQCTSVKFLNVPEDNTLQISIQTQEDAVFMVMLQLTYSFHDTDCDVTKAPEESKPTVESANTTYFITPIKDNLISEQDEPSDIIKYILLSMIPVIAGITIATVFIIRKHRGKSAIQAGSAVEANTVETQGSNTWAIYREENQYVETVNIAEYEGQIRNSFISYQSSVDDQIQEEEIYGYDNDEVAVPEQKGYLVPTKDREGYLVPIDKSNEDVAGMDYGDDDAFGGYEEVYATVREVYYRSESYSED